MRTRAVCCAWSDVGSPGSRATSFHTCQVLRPRRAVWTLAFTRPSRVAFRIRNGVGTRDKNLCEAQWLACVLPYRRFAAALTDDCARLGADVVSYSFIVSDLHRLLVAGLPAHCERLWTLPGAQARAAPQPRNRSSARPLAGSRHRLGAADGILLACKVKRSNRRRTPNCSISSSVISTSKRSSMAIISSMRSRKSAPRS